MEQRKVVPFGPPAHFYECPRWHDGRWWASDMRGGTVYSFAADGSAQVELEIDDRPAGLGWTPDGQLLVVSMEAKALLRRARSSHEIERRHNMAHLFGGIGGFLNDLAVGSSGQVYIGFNADPHDYPRDADLGMIVCLAPNDEARVVAERLAFPNGLVFTPDGGRLVAAETMRPRLSSFAVAADGSLGAREDWGTLNPRVDIRSDPQPPFLSADASLDGCAMDAQGHIWAADVQSGCLRIAPGGAIVDAVFLPDGLRTFACALGGPDGQTLMICGADDNFSDRTSRREAQLFTARVDVPASSPQLV